MSDPIKALGLTCPSEAKFYICAEKPSRFLGCCTTDPCKTDDGVCPPENVRSSSFDMDVFHDIPPQSCVLDQIEIKWYTCAGNTPFLGCCDVNACEEGGCPAASLQAASLSRDEKKAKVFLSGDATETSTPTSTASATATLGTEAKNDQGGASLPHAAVAAIGVASTVVLGLICVFIFWYWRKQKRSQATESVATQTSPKEPQRPDERMPSTAEKAKTTKPHPQNLHPQAYHRSHDPYQAYYPQPFQYPRPSAQTSPFYMSYTGQGYPNPHPGAQYHPSMSSTGFPQYHAAPVPPIELSSSPRVGQTAQPPTAL